MPEKIILEEDSAFEYYIDIEKGVVAAVMTNPFHEALSYMERMSATFSDHGMYMPLTEYFAKHLASPIRAKATCHENDEFDLDYGMKLAKKRCLAKYYKRLTNCIIEVNDRVDPVLSYIEDTIVSCANKYTKFAEN